MSKTAVMIDLETLATSPDAAILSIGAVKFDPFGNETTDYDEFYLRVDVDSCDSINLTVSDDTIEWWSKQSQEAQDEAFNPENRVHIKDAFEQLYKFCWGCKTVWSNGAAFDVVICETVFNRIGKKVPWEYWQVRDCRTLFDQELMGIDPQKPAITAHNALDDALAQAISVQNVLRKLRGIK